MRNFKLVNGDLVLDGQNNFEMVEGDDELIQCIQELLTTNLGEWFLNRGIGFPRFEVLGNKYNQNQLIDAVNETILQEERVSRIENVEVSLNREKREVTIFFEIVKNNGETVSGEVVVR